MTVPFSLPRPRELKKLGFSTFRSQAIRIVSFSSSNIVYRAHDIGQVPAI